MHYLVIDFEATCCNKNTFPRSEMEIIEIGAVLCAAKTFTVLQEFNCFVKPLRHPLLTTFCVELTTIKQHDVDNASNFPLVLEEFTTWVNNFISFDQVLFCSWGNFDHWILQENCEYHKVKYPFINQHINLKKRFQSVQGLVKQVGMSQALQMKDITLTGTHHRGLDDAKNIAKLLPFCK
jgi:inhibitor of KinA sporulation pathway (predicted exonuclease)